MYFKRIVHVEEDRFLSIDDGEEGIVHLVELGSRNAGGPRFEQLHHLLTTLCFRKQLPEFGGHSHWRSRVHSASALKLDE